MRETGAKDARLHWIDTLSAPLFISWQITRDCDLACVHCCTDSAPGHGLHDELSEAQMMDLAAQIIAANVPYVMLCGGEPLLVPHFVKLAEKIGQAGVQLKIETNGQNLDQATLDRLAALPIRSIQISLDADTEAVYRRQRPGGSLAKAHATCRAVRAAGLPLEVTFAPTRYNIAEFEAVLKRATDFGAFRFNTGMLMHIGRAARLWQKIRPDNSEIEKFFERIEEKTMRRVQSAIEQMPEICYTPWTIAEGLMQSRAAPPATMLIMPNGLVKIAGASGFVCSDLRNTDLVRAWSDYRLAWRDATVLEDIDRCIVDEAYQANANRWVLTTRGVEHHERNYAYNTDEK